MIIRLTADQQHDEEKHMMCWAHLPASPPCPGQRCTRRPVSACRGSAHNPTPRTCGPWARRGGSFPPAAGRWGWRRRPPRRHRLEGRPVRTRRPRRRPPRWTWTHTTWPLHTRTARRRCAPPHGPWTTWYVYYVVWLLLSPALWIVLEEGGGQEEHLAILQSCNLYLRRDDVSETGEFQKLQRRQLRVES